MKYGCLLSLCMAMYDEQKAFILLSTIMFTHTVIYSDTCTDNFFNTALLIYNNLMNLWCLGPLILFLSVKVMDELSLLLLHMWQCRIMGSIIGRLRYKSGCDTNAMRHKIDLLVEKHVSKYDICQCFTQLTFRYSFGKISIWFLWNYEIVSKNNHP